MTGTYMSSADSEIWLINHGYANISSVRNAVEKLGMKCVIVSSIDELKAYSKEPKGIILPGVGAFGPAMKSLRQKGLDRLLLKHIQFGTRVMGICLGMQMLCSMSEEDSMNERGLDVFKGAITRLPEHEASVPNMGWHSTTSRGQTDDLRILLNADFYYVHSYGYYSPSTSECIATFKHGSTDGVAAIRKGNVLGVQFHPEKSQAAGMRVLESFFNLKDL